MHIDIRIDHDHCLRPQVGRDRGQKRAACLAGVARFHRHDDVERDAARRRNGDAFPDGTNDFEVAGGLRGAPVELVHCTTIDVDVPSRAEFVIEFEADFTKEVMEGPLGEYTGYYTPASPKPIARVKAITHRNGAYFQGLLTGVPPTENHILKQIPFEASFLAMMRKQFPAARLDCSRMTMETLQDRSA
jgi:hypothetical protein